MFHIELQPSDERQHVEFFNDGNVVAHFERSPIGPLIHCTVEKWNKESKDITHVVLYEICKEFYSRGIESIFALVSTDDRKHKKFIAQYGFQFVMYGEDQDKNGLELWELSTDVGED